MFPNVPTLGIAVCKLFTSWVSNAAAETLPILRDSNASEVVVAFLETANRTSNKELFTAGTSILSLLAGQSEIIQTVEKVGHGAQLLAAQPANVEVMKQLAVSVAMFGNLAASASNLPVLIKSGIYQLVG